MELQPAEETWRDEPCYYVSSMNYGKIRLLSGPFRTHAEAEAAVEKAKLRVYDLDPWAAFYKYGTVKTRNGRCKTAF